MKLCSKCKIVKPAEQFAKAKRESDGLQDRCKTCNAEYRKANAARIKAYSEANAEKLRAYTAQWRKANLEKRRAYDKAYAEANPEKIRAKNRRRAPRTEYDAERAKMYPEKFAAKTAKRRATKKLATPVWANEEKIAEFYSAAAFLSMVTGEWYHVDHIVPLTGKAKVNGVRQHVVCGLHWEGNLQILPGRENEIKSCHSWPDA